MKTISRPGDNMGGLIKFWAVPYDVYSLSDQSVTFSNTDNIYEIYCSPESMEFSEPSLRPEAGLHYNTNASGFIPKDSRELIEAIEYLEPRKWVLILRDGNGDFKLAGTNFTPLRFKSTLNSGKNTSDRAGCSINFSGKTFQRAVFIDNPFL